MLKLIYSDKNKKCYLLYDNKIVLCFDCKSKKQSQFYYNLLVAFK